MLIRTEMKLVSYYKQRLSAVMREELKKISELEYYVSDPDLHYRREEGFICNECKIAVGFFVE